MSRIEVTDEMLMGWLEESGVMDSLYDNEVCLAYGRKVLDAETLFEASKVASWIDIASTRALRGCAGISDSQIVTECPHCGESILIGG